MANRSHLYTCDDVPGADDFYARGLSEVGWDIPLVHKLMVAGAPRLVRSAIWGDHEIGILADRAKAFERAISFFDALGAGELADRAEFDREFEDMKAFLAATPPTRYVLLEAGEIFDILGGELRDEAQRLLDEIPLVAGRADSAIRGEADEWLATLRKNWKESARPGWWSDVLYFSFARDDD